MTEQASQSELLKRDEPVINEEPDEQDILNVLQGYFDEADTARSTGPNARDEIWRLNWDRYWGRYDHSQKASWQSKHVMPEVAQFVDRWAAAMREALTQGGRWFAVTDESGQSNELTPHVEKFMDLLLSRCTKTADGHQADFESFFEDQMKLGALMTMSAAVTWKDGWVAVESTDPREVWLDPERRNLYRVRQYEVDKHDLLKLARKEDSEGEPLYNLQAIKDLSADVDEDARNNRERSSGHGQDQGTTNRTPITIREYLCDLIMPDGTVAAENALLVTANHRFLIRGPEPNPFWHRRDWLVNCPMVSVPFSVYGRSYAEDWADPADAFVELTNLILDGVFTSTMKAFWGNPEALADPTQLEEGISPNVLYQLAEEIMDGRKVIGEIDLGSLPPESIQVWTALKQEMREGAKLNEIALGQVPPKGDITATEVRQVSQSGSAMIRSMARTVESRFLEPVLTLVFQTALQHMNFDDPQVQAELGAETAQMLAARRMEFRDRGVHFRVRGLSGIVDRQMKLQSLMGMLQTISQNELLMREFISRTDMGSLLDEMYKLFGVDKSAFQMSERERMIRQALQQGGQEQPGGQSGSPPRQPQSSPFSEGA